MPEKTKKERYEDRIAEVRQTLLDAEVAVLALSKDEYLSELGPQSPEAGEAIANVKLAYRHAEDSRMRLGKVFQALNGGVSNNTR